MRGRLAVILAAVALLGAGIAVAVGSLNEEAMVSRSYYEGVYLPALTDALRQRAEKGTEATYEQAEKALSEGDLTPWPGYTLAQMGEGDELELAVGSCLLLYDGGGRLTAGTLADVTGGVAVGAGQTLAPAHRYIVTAEGGAVVAQTLPGRLGYQGEGTVRLAAALTLPFADVAEGDWFHDAVSFVYRRGYFSGTGADTFAPNASMDRAMVATVLHRMSGAGTVSGAAAFSDVPAGQWYSDGVAWASASGVVNGMGDGLYAPALAVTREQLVTMLYRYEKDYRKAAVAETGDLSAFPDGGSVSAWAQDAMSWAVGAGLLHGRDSGALDPTGTATRAEVAAILQRFSQRS